MRTFLVQFLSQADTETTQISMLQTIIHNILAPLN